MERDQYPWLLRIREVEELTGYPRSTIYQLLNAGAFRSLTVGRSRRVVAEDLRRWIDEQAEREAASRDDRDG